MTTAERLYTVADLQTLPDDGKRYELVRGVLIEMPPPGQEHGLVTSEIVRLIGNHVRANDLGRVFTESGYLLSEDPDTVRAPNISFIAKSRLPSLKETYARIAPDLVVEVMSPGNSLDDMNEKIARYFEAGAQRVWLFFPKTRMIYDYHSAKDIKVLDGDDLLDGGDILPGFSVKVSDIFKVLD
jgi:Uma2 family endonuclease